MMGLINVSCVSDFGSLGITLQGECEAESFRLQASGETRGREASSFWLQALQAHVGGQAA